MSPVELRFPGVGVQSVADRDTLNGLSGADGNYAQLADTNEVYYYDGTAGWVPALLAGATFTSILDPLDGDVLPDTLGDWSDTDTLLGTITISGGAVRWAGSVSADTAWSLGTHSPALAGANWYMRCEAECTAYGGSNYDSAGVFLIYDGVRVFRLGLRHPAASDRASFYHSGAVLGQVVRDVVMSSMGWLDVYCDGDEVSVFHDGALLTTVRYSAFAADTNDRTIIGDSTGSANAIMRVRNHTMWRWVP